MAHEFVILDENDKLQPYTRWEDIPPTFKNVIKFLPEIPEGPHTAEEHAEIEQWNGRLQLLGERQTHG